MNKIDPILEAATRLFIEYGFHGTSTSKIAQAAGISNGTLFHYFPTKEELISAIYVNIKQELRTTLFLGLAEDATTKRKIKTVWLNWVHWGLTHEYDFKFIELFANSPFVQRMSRDEAERAFEFAHDILERGIAEDILIDLDPKLLGMIIYASVHTTVRYAFAQPKSIHEDELDTLFAMLWQSIVNL